jgi:hypothetical protein
MNAPCVGASIERSARADPSSVGSAHKADRKLLPDLGSESYCRAWHVRDAGRDACSNVHECVGSVVGGCPCSRWVRGHWSREVGTGRDAHLREGFQAVGLWCGCGVQLACVTRVCVAGLSLADGWFVQVVRFHHLQKHCYSVIITTLGFSPRCYNDLLSHTSKSLPLTLIISLKGWLDPAANKAQCRRHQHRRTLVKVFVCVRGSCLGRVMMSSNCVMCSTVSL